MSWLKGCSLSVCALMLIVGCANNPSHSGSSGSSKVKVKKLKMVLTSLNKLIIIKILRALLKFHRI